jgi:hypothetical protein
MPTSPARRWATAAVAAAEGTLGGIYDFRFTPDFAGGRTIVLDAFATARVQPWLAVTAGKFKERGPFVVEPDEEVILTRVAVGF